MSFYSLFINKNLEHMNKEELEEVAEKANSILAKMQELKLWEDVVKATNKYQKECKPITVHCLCCNNECNAKLEKPLDPSTPGHIYID